LKFTERRDNLRKNMVQMQQDYFKMGTPSLIINVDALKENLEKNIFCSSINVLVPKGDN
jgi:hypothetical protein